MRSVHLSIIDRPRAAAAPPRGAIIERATPERLRHTKDVAEIYRKKGIEKKGHVACG